MAFENLTLFELHLENARIGPSFRGDDEEAEETEAASSSGGGRPVGRGVVALALLAVGAAVALRRLRGGSDGDSEQITIEHAVEQ